ncbi:type I-E CRISPR-associated protein Cas6/Cse3/CasE [Streptomyces sp. SPB074]|uniref:type I-E CRISPR-associated protein Cas6/Cse3/CasE n=1 Tax=Streptomyces sp. (strain SPB074) TaxID=465543 RepID=UPI00017F0E42|nr:type I-E CRISPR-associated protein Cas6/Cse3/CasE [Streptomyces sp. SPB074]EDY43248.1 cse3 family CRISPR-associated protein [Streptomyces sp. SPB074]
MIENRVWLTQIVPHTGLSAEATRDLRSAVNLHKRVMSLFPDDLGERARQQTGALFRFEEDATRGSRLLVQSVVTPDPTRLPARYGAVRSTEITPLLQRLRPGVRVNYRLTGNATRTLSRDTTAGRPNQVIPLHGADAEEWWLRRAASAGLDIHKIHTTELDDAAGNRHDKQRIRHARTRFDGTATVTDPDALRTCVTTGIGRGKSYGCGLLSLAPAR